MAHELTLPSRPRACLRPGSRQPGVTLTDQTADLADRLETIRRQMAAVAADRPTREQLAEWNAADKETAQRIRAALPGVPLHHAYAVLRALRTVQRMDAAAEEPESAAPASSAGRAPATDQTARREQLAAAVRSITVVGGAPPRRLVPVSDGSNPRMAQIVDWQPLEDFLDALAAVLPAPADRAAVLLWAADQIDAETQQAKTDGVLEPDKYRPCRDASAQLRRLACPTPLTHNWGCGCPTDQTTDAELRRVAAEPATDKPADDDTQQDEPRAGQAAWADAADWLDALPLSGVEGGVRTALTRLLRDQARETQQDPTQDGTELPSSTAPLASGLPLIKGDCPACRRASLFLGTGGYPTCANADCTEPDAATTVLEQYANEAHPPEHRWAAELYDPVADEWVPGTRYPVRERAVNALTHARSIGPAWKDGTPVQRRLVRATTTYTVEDDAAVARPGQPDTGTQPAGTAQQTREA